MLLLRRRPSTVTNEDVVLRNRWNQEVRLGSARGTKMRARTRPARSSPTGSGSENGNEEDARVNADIFP